MNITEQVTKWVENKIGKVINEELKEIIVEENVAFDVETYANNLLEKYFKDDDIRSLKEILKTDSYYDLLYIESENSSEEQSVRYCLEFESNEYQTFSVETIIKNFENESIEVRKKTLVILEACIEDIINQTSWSRVKEMLQKMLNNTEDREIVKLILKILQKPLRCPKKLQIVSKGFSTIVELLTSEIELFNLEYKNYSGEEMRNGKECERLCEKKSLGFRRSKCRGFKNQKSIRSEILIKLMWLLIECQQQMPVKWVRFNEVRFREIIFSFIRLLNTTHTTENTKLSGLELLSVLNPKASWCSYWCHTAVGRSLLCSALRKYKNIFVQIIEITLNHMKLKKANKLPPVTDGIGFSKISPKYSNDVSVESKRFPKNLKVDYQIEKKNYLQKINLNGRSKCNSSGPEDNAESNFSKNVKLKNPRKVSSDWIVENIPKRIVTEAVFFHSISFVSCLIQFRSGRALFPVQTTTRKRLVSVQDLSLSIIEYLENFEYEWASTGITYTSTYESKVSEILEILKKVKTHINSSRMSSERQGFSYL